MKKIFPLLPLLLFIASCTSAHPVEVAPTPIAYTQAENTREAEVIEGVVVPAEQSQLAFLVPGTVIQISKNEGDFVRKGETLLVIHNPDLDSAVMEAKAGLAVVEAEYEYWKRPRDKPPERRWMAEALVLEKKASWQRTLAEKDEVILHAPYDATIITNEATLGAYLNPHQKVILLADLSNLLIKTTNLSEREIVALEIGQNALVFIEALNLEIPAKITALAPRATPENNDMLYTATLQLDEIPDGLRWGMNVEIEFDEE